MLQMDDLVHKLVNIGLREPGGFSFDLAKRFGSLPYGRLFDRLRNLFFLF